MLKKKRTFLSYFINRLFFLIIIVLPVIFQESCNIQKNMATPSPVLSPTQAVHSENPYSAADSPWPLFSHDSAHTGFTNNLGPSKGNLKWIFKTGGPVYSSPVTDADGVVYIGSDDCNFYAINRDGSLKWKFKTGGKIRSSAAITRKGTIYFTSFDGFFYALNSDGSEAWNFKTGEKHVTGTSPVSINNEGIIYFTVYGKTSGNLYSLSPEGKEMWKIKTKDKDASVVTGENGSVYLGDYGVSAITPDGTVKYHTGKNLTSKPSLRQGDVIYIAETSDEKHTFMAMSEKNKKWSIPLRANMTASASISGEGSIFIACYDGKIYSLDSIGNINWSQQTSDIIRSSPAIDGEGNVYTGSYDGKFYAFSRNGEILWTLQTGDAIESSPAIGDKEDLYFSSLDGHVYAIHSDDIQSGGTPVPSPSVPAVTGNCQNGERNRKSSGPSVPLLKWTQRLQDVPVTSPLITDDGNIYVGTGERDEPVKIYSLDNSGNIRWIFDGTGNKRASHPVADSSGNIYFTTWNQKIISLGSDGKLKWSFTCNDSFKYPPSIGKNGLIYASCGNELYCLNSKGILQWQVQLDDLVCSKPLAGSDGYIYQPTGDGYLFRVKGKIKKKINISRNIMSASMDKYGNICLFSREGVYLYKPDGKKIKLYGTEDGENIQFEPVFMSDGDITVITGNVRKNSWKLLCLGERKWEFQIKKPACTHITDRYDNIYIASEDGSITVLSPGGNKIEEFKSRGTIFNSPAISSDGTVFLVYSVIDRKTGKSMESGMEKISPSGIMEEFYSFSGSSSASVIKENIYLVSSGKLFALTSKGLIKWSLPVTSSVTNNPVADRDENIFLGCKDGQIVAINRNGFYSWSFKTGGSVESSPLIDGNYIYFGSDDGYLYCLDLKGKKEWSFYTGAPVKSAPSIKDSLIYITSDNGYLYALNKKGNLKWKLNVNSVTTPCISSKCIFLINNEGHLIAIKDGKILWNYNTGGIYSPGFDRNTVYAVSKKGLLYAIKSDGTLKWTFKASGSIITPPLVDMNGTVYFSTDKGLIYGINSHGIKKWSFKLKYGRAIDLNISSERFLYIVSDAGYIYVFGE